MYILVFLAALGSLLGWISIAQIMVFPTFLYSFGIIVIFVLTFISTISVGLNKNKKGEDSHDNTDNML